MQYPFHVIECKCQIFFECTIHFIGVTPVNSISISGMLTPSHLAGLTRGSIPGAEVRKHQHAGFNLAKINSIFRIYFQSVVYYEISLNDIRGNF